MTDATGPVLPTVLVVDDDETVRRVLRLSLEFAGFRVLTAEDGRRALDVMRSALEVVDLILTDVVMPEMDGVALAQAVLATSHPPTVLMMSGYLDDRDRLRRAIGADVGFVQKPFDMDELVAQLRDALETE